MDISHWRIATVTLIVVLATACAATPRQTEQGADAEQLNTSAADRTHKAKRMVSKGTQFGWLVARSVYENPINRPVSHFSSLASFALKSTGGLLQRIAIATVKMPALDDAIPELSYREPMNLDAFEKVLDRVTGTRRDSGRIKFLVDGEEYFSRLISAICSANESIDIRTYIFDNDDYAVEFADMLKKRSADVRVRVMLDQLGNMMAMQADAASMPVAHKGPLSMRRYLQRGSDINVRNVNNPWLASSDHTKTTIIDRQIAFLGGMNIGREYRFEWHDLMFEVSGPVVDKLQFESDKAWARASLFGDLANFIAFLKGKKTRADKGGYPVRILQTRNFDSDIHKAQIAAIQNAQSYILIENAYFSDDRTVYELARARRRGVDVRVIIPAQGNHAALNASNKVTVNKLLKNGIRVYEYPEMSHIKAAIFDGWISVGSANFDKLSLKINKELNLATSDPDTVQALLDQLFIPDMMASRELNSPFEITIADRLAEIAVDELL